MTSKRQQLDDLSQFFLTHLAPEDFRVLSAACNHEPEFRALVARPLSKKFMIRAVEAAVRRPEESLDQWIVRVTAQFLDSMCEGQDSTLSVLATVAHEGFLLDECPRYDRSYIEDECPLNDEGDASEWLAWSGYSDASFSNGLVGDYFVAREISSQRGESLMRFEYPRRWVLMFLAIIAPELVARMTAVRGGELRAEIEEEVSQRVQAALSHQLKRSAGAVRYNLLKFRSKLSSETAYQLQTEYDRILQEAQFQIDLAERTGLWSAQPELKMEAMTLLSLVEEVLAPLHKKFSNIELLISVPPTLRAHGDARLVGEIVFCLAENAFHAVAFADSGEPKRVEIRGVDAPRTARIEFLDTGPGVHPGDVVQVFEPRVTTKKGGKNQPLGTGMGLTIARRYARLMSGSVDIDTACSETCFFLELPRTAAEEPL